MKRKSKKRIAALVVAATLIFTGINAPVHEVKAGKTIAGNPEIIQIGADALEERENNFNKGWKFYLGTSSKAQDVSFDDSEWKNINLPHDFSISQAYTTTAEAESGFLPGGTGWYRKTFTMPESAEGKTVLLNFDGVYADATVYVNGEKVGEHHYGYTSFAFDISDKLTCDGSTENVIAVQAVNNVPSSRWYSGSGIYRDVTLVITDPVHVDLNGTYVTTPNIADDNGTVNVKVDVVNDGTETATVTVTNTVYKKGQDSGLATATTTVDVAADATVTAETNPVVSDPELWDIDEPNLYVVHTVLTVNGEEVDSYDTTFGFRYFSFDSTGFHLNGENVKLNGVCLHHDQGALGSAAYYDAMYRQLAKMKDMGCNAIRTAHNPADEDFIDICSELGLLVIEEAFDGLVDVKNYNNYDFSVYFEQALGTDNNLYGGTDTMTYAEYAAKSMVKRDRNEPSIIAWSFGNEIQEGTHWETVSRYDDIAAQFIGWVKALDSTRPVTNGDNNRGADADLVNVINTITSNGGVAGFNYANTVSKLNELAQSYGGSTGAIIASETSSAINSRSVYTTQASAGNVHDKYHLTSYDTSSVSWGITAHDSIYNTYQCDNVAGEFVWTGFDYLGEPTPWNDTDGGAHSDADGGPYPNSSYFGIVETTGFEKDTYYLYRSQWNKAETTLHLVTAWDSENMMTTDGTMTPVWVYSNAPVVKLYKDEVHIGTATRVTNTSAAGHTYYTYTTSSENDDICTTSSGSAADGLYAVFNVAYTEGTLSARAFQTDGSTEITLSGNSGQNTVTTPGTVSKLAVAADQTTVEADGSSLTYIEVDVTDANGNLDTTAENNIVFTLTGEGEIVGVDNGDQAAVDKFQQASVLKSNTSANIDAYAGKALVIVRSTEDAGSFTVNAESTGLASGSVSVTTTGAGGSSAQTGLVSYTMVKDYTVKVGTEPTLTSESTGTMDDGSSVDGTIAWDAVSSATYNTAGDYTITGALTFEDLEAIPVTARLHVIDNVIAMRNISTVTTPGVVPALPNVVKGVLADGTLSGEFSVQWDSISADSLMTVGNIVVVNGTAQVFGDETLPVTCSIRVAEEVNTSSTNVAQQATVSQNINGSDNLNSVNNGISTSQDNTNERWSNWGNRTTSAEATLTFAWATAQSLSSVNIIYYYDSCSAYPESIEFSHSSNGIDYIVIGATAQKIEDQNHGAKWSYTFDEPVNPVALAIKFTQQSGTTGDHCVAVIEIETMTYVGELEYNSSADLSGITVDGTPVENFAAGTLEYESSGSTVAAATDVNAGITVLPAYEGVVRILTISEDGETAKTYEVRVAEACAHANTVVQNQKEANCTEAGYTGDTYCNDCQTTITTGTSTAALGHSWDEGTVTTEPTTETEGVKTYTCENCSQTRTEAIPKIEKMIPSVSISAEKTENGKIAMTGIFNEFTKAKEYCDITEHGLVYYQTVRLGSNALTVNTQGRTRVTFTEYNEDGSFVYKMTPVSEGLKYTVRAYLAYTDAAGNIKYIYPSPRIVSLELL